MASVTCRRTSFGKAHQRQLVSLLSAETGGFDCYTIPDFEIYNVGSDFDDCAGGLVTQHLWLLDEVVTDSTVGVGVQLSTRTSTKADVEVGRFGTNIATANSSHFDLDQHVVVTDVRDRDIANLDGRWL